MPTAPVPRNGNLLGSGTLFVSLGVLLLGLGMTGDQDHLTGASYLKLIIHHEDFSSVRGGRGLGDYRMEP